MSIVLYPLNTDMKIYEANGENAAVYSELKEYEHKLKEDITQLKGQLADKRAYLASLDEQLFELECHYNKLLEENTRISDRLNSLNAGKDKK